MAGRSKTLHICNQCGAVHPRWSGKCDDCGAWNSIAEEVREASAYGKAGKSSAARGGRKSAGSIALENLGAGGEGAMANLPRLMTGIAEFDRVLGGGLVPGSATLIGGDPGIGKSTLLLQAACRVAANNPGGVAYFSGEESTDQIRMRAARLGLAAGAGGSMGLAAATDTENIRAAIESGREIKLVIIDSIQTLYLAGIDSGPGTVSQVRASAHELIRCAKRLGFALLIVGHVTKDGAIAGPKVLEHMVDTVLQFEGESSHHFRILRGIKNRFGPTDEIGVFEMTGQGLAEVANPSELFLADRRDDVSGAVVFAGLEGTRPLLVEIQALVAPSAMPHPRRNVVGWDSGRLAMLAAVLESRGGIALSSRDIFLNVAGGVKITEPAADCAVAAALISAVTGMPCPRGTVFFGEVGLGAEIRRVAHPEQRLKEAAKLGFDSAITPVPAKKERRGETAGLTITHVAGLGELIENLGGAGKGA